MESQINYCPKCKKSVGGGESVVVVYNGIHFHEECFCCFVCGTNTLKKFYEVQPVCQKCYQEKAAPKCFGCQKLLEWTYGNECVTILGHDYHRDCAKCAKCKETFKGEQYIPFNGAAYCFDCHAKVQKELLEKRLQEMAKTAIQEVPKLEVKQPEGTGNSQKTETSTTA